MDWNATSRYIIDLTDMDQVQNEDREETSATSIALIAAPTMTAVLLLIAIAVCTLILRKKWQTQKAQCDPDSSADMLENRYVEQPRRFDRWEIPRRRLIVNREEKLGSGAFGAVYKGKWVPLWGAKGGL